jgi:Protein of unknown function (DUF2628)
MPVYTVHAPSTSAADLRAADAFVFARDGFHFWAMILGPFWLVWNRLWLAAIGWVILTVGLEIGLARLGAGRAAIWSAEVLVALLLGLEAGSLKRWTLSRRRWRELDTVVADNEEAAEHRFFDRWAKSQGGVSYDPLTVDRGGPPPTRNIPSQRFSEPPPLPAGGIIGLFPEPGGPP